MEVFKKLLMELQTDKRKEFLLWRSGKLMFVHLRRLWNMCSAHRLTTTQNEFVLS